MLTRRARPLPLLAAAAALLLAGCGAPAPAPAGAGAPSAPDDPVVVALDDFAALNAMSLGVQPDLVLEVFGYTSTAAVFADAGVPTQPYGSGLDVEQVLAAGPDVVLGVSLPTTLEAEDELRAAVPGTTVLDYTASWQEQLTATAAALGVPERAPALQERLDADLAALAADLEAAGLAGAAASVLAESDGVFSPPPTTPAGTVLADVGLGRPAAQQQATAPDTPFVPVSPEGLTDHAGDVVYLLSGGGYDTTTITGNPLWPTVEAGARAGVHEVSGEAWFGSSAFTVDWIARDLRATLLDGAPAATDADAPARFRAFTAG